jgi:hypothetical protein
VVFLVGLRPEYSSSAMLFGLLPSHGTARRVKGFDSPSGFTGAAPSNPLLHPCSNLILDPLQILTALTTTQRRRTPEGAALSNARVRHGVPNNAFFSWCGSTERASRVPLFQLHLAVFRALSTSPLLRRRPIDDSSDNT